jgi:hypothetical protein
MRFWFEKKWVIEHGQCALKYHQLLENPPYRLLGVTRDEYLDSLDTFRLSGQYRKIQPTPEVKKWFLRYGKFFRHITLTAVPQKAAHVSAEWVLRHFGVWIRTFHFVPSFRKGKGQPQYDKNKKDFLKWIDKIDIFIDDNEANLKQAKELGIKGILFPRPWNSSKLTINETLRNIG